MIANINNTELSVKIIDNNYSFDAIEVEILEGTFKGKYAIVEKKDLKKASVTKIVNLGLKEMLKENVTREDLENNALCELLQQTNNLIANSCNELIVISNKDWNTIYNTIYGGYNDITDLKYNILYDTIYSRLIGEKKSIKEVIEEYKRYILQ